MKNLAVVALTASLALAACAVGTTETGAGAGDDGGASDDGATQADSGHADGPSFSDAAEPDATPGDDGGASDAGADSAGVDSGTTTIPCDPPAPCSGATSIGTISGDTSSPDVHANGTTSKWLRIDVTENDSGILGVPMKLAVALSSPPNANFDLYVYLGSGLGTLECNAVKASSTNGPGQTDSVGITWGETGTFSNGVDDGKTVTIEVRAVSTPCDPNASWSLSVHGH